jgi:hypothetical protein
MKYFDYRLVESEYSINYDCKHIIKRIAGFVISEKRNITLIKSSINKNILVEILKDKQQYVEHLINPKDRQNVPAAVSLFKLIKSVSENINEGNHIKADALSEYQLLAKIVDLLLSIFVNPSISLFKQLCNLALLSHVILFVYRKHKTAFLTNDLYSDIQSTIQDAFVCAAKKVENNSTSPLFLYQLGTDQLENLFSTIRTLSHSRNYN